MEIEEQLAKEALEQKAAAEAEVAAAAAASVKAEEEEGDDEEKGAPEEAEEVVEECGVEVDDDFMQQMTHESQLESADAKTPATYATRTKTGVITPRNYVQIVKRRSGGGGGSATSSAATASTPSTNGSLVPAPSGGAESSSGPPFKLGMEGRHKTYVNQYSSNSSALNKTQIAEERDRKRYLSHKFSLTGAGEFKWCGSTFGNKTTMLQTIRSTLLQLHSQILATFMHPNWNLMRKPWIAAVNACVSPRDLGRALSVLAACIRPVVFNSAWQESLGHVRLHRHTALEREEKKKVDKKEKKEKELEEEMHRLHTVHYTKGLKHQVRSRPCCLAGPMP